ncbi:hypothetical protein [Paenibacillus xylanexedens]|uniref:Uncharacterized protein n=1 Tax=Paenibacillus xylanexedens TaxID=528191 RepID=A0ABS4RUB7_PAEXY|nr:hypothetical protein [Paenibacillus xylanexedens]APO43039.1 hypothetical protein BS614_02455 [Paenibacillus xylanexedens]MBP2246041.1 hypothetical protein [Paenibacillus xylanexedens]
MKKKIMIGLLTAVACMTIGSTSFATSVTIPNNNAVESVHAAPFATKYVKIQQILPKSLYPTLGDIPTTLNYAENDMYGVLQLLSMDRQTGYTWTVTYGGYISN